MTSQPSTFGPTDVIPCDENEQPFAVVQIALTLTRAQLRAALAIGHAELSGEPPLPDLGVLDVRREVEGYLAAGAVFEIDRQAITDRLPADLVAALDAAIDRAYTRPTPTAEAQDPVYRDGTVTLNTLDHGQVTIDEPAWCRGHDGDTVGTLAEISHEGAEAVAAVDSATLGEIVLLRANLTHALHLQRQPEPHPLVYLEGADAASFDRVRLRTAAARLAVFADTLRDLARQLPGGGQ